MFVKHLLLWLPVWVCLSVYPSLPASYLLMPQARAWPAYSFRHVLNSLSTACFQSKDSWIPSHGLFHNQPTQLFHESSHFMTCFEWDTFLLPMVQARNQRCHSHPLCLRELYGYVLSLVLCTETLYAWEFPYNKQNCNWWAKFDVKYESWVKLFLGAFPTAPAPLPVLWYVIPSR